MNRRLLTQSSRLFSIKNASFQSRSFSSVCSILNDKVNRDLDSSIKESTNLSASKDPLTTGRDPVETSNARSTGRARTANEMDQSSHKWQDSDTSKEFFANKQDKNKKEDVHEGFSDALKDQYKDIMGKKDEKSMKQNVTSGNKTEEKIDYMAGESPYDINLSPGAKGATVAHSEVLGDLDTENIKNKAKEWKTEGQYAKETAKNKATEWSQDASKQMKEGKEQVKSAFDQKPTATEAVKEAASVIGEKAKDMKDKVVQKATEWKEKVVGQ